MAEDERRGGAGRDVGPDPLDERVVDPDVDQAAGDSAGAGAERQPRERDEEDQPEQQAPEAAPQRARAPSASRARGPWACGGLRPGDDGGVVDPDRPSLGQRSEPVDGRSAPSAVGNIHTVSVFISVLPPFHPPPRWQWWVPVSARGVRAPFTDRHGPGARRRRGGGGCTRRERTGSAARTRPAGRPAPPPAPRPAYARQRERAGETGLHEAEPARVNGIRPSTCAVQNASRTRSGRPRATASSASSSEPVVEAPRPTVASSATGQRSRNTSRIVSRSRSRRSGGRSSGRGADARGCAPTAAHGR